MKKTIVTLTIIITSIIACKKNETQVIAPVANGSSAPVLPTREYDYSDKSSNPNNSLITLGRVLFYDKNLSFNNSISCGSCHKQNKGFADDVQFHVGVLGNKLTRNTLAISGDGSNLFWDGRSQNITNLILKPIANHDEMLQDLSKLSAKLNKIEYYKPLVNNAFGNDLLDLDKINKAIAAFCKTLTPADSKFSNFFITNASNSPALSESETRGWSIFSSKGKCSGCHNVFSNFFYSSSFHNNGLDTKYADNGLSLLTNKTDDEGVFKTPNLANVALTAPYMHDGRFKTLEDVVEFYNSGVQKHPNLDFALRDISQSVLDSLSIALENSGNNQLLFQQIMNQIAQTKEPLRLNLTHQEKIDLVNFLKTLTDESLSVDPRFSNPFKN